MKIYGFIEHGQLQCKYIEPYTRNECTADGRLVTRVVSEEEQIASLDPIWKPVQEVDESIMASATGYEVVVPTPYDAGDHIAFSYERVKDTQRIRREIEANKASLAASDYKVIKCYEASLLGLPLPYDLEAFHSEREAQRAKINRLEAIM